MHCSLKNKFSLNKTMEIVPCCRFSYYQKTWQLRMHCNLRPPEPRQSFPALIATWRHAVLGPIAFLLLIHYFTLWPWPLTLNICSVSPVRWWNSVPDLNAIEQFLRRSYCHFNVWPYDPTPHVEVGSTHPWRGKDIGRSSQHCTFVSGFGYAAFSNAGGSKLSDVLNDSQFRIFDPPVKIRGGVSEISIEAVYLRPNLRNTFDGHPAAPLLHAVDWLTKKKKVHW